MFFWTQPFVIVKSVYVCTFDCICLQAVVFASSPSFSPSTYHLCTMFLIHLIPCISQLLQTVRPVYSAVGVFKEDPEWTSLSLWIIYDGSLLCAEWLRRLKREKFEKRNMEGKMKKHLELNNWVEIQKLSISQVSIQSSRAFSLKAHTLSNIKPPSLISIQC